MNYSSWHEKPDVASDLFCVEWTPIGSDPIVYRFHELSDGWWYQIGMTNPSGEVVPFHLSCIQGQADQRIRAQLFENIYRIEGAKELWIRTFTTWRD